jgi:hypothetical protein
MVAYSFALVGLLVRLELSNKQDTPPFQLLKEHNFWIYLSSRTGPP